MLNISCILLHLGTNCRHGTTFCVDAQNHAPFWVATQNVVPRLRVVPKLSVIQPIFNIIYCLSRVKHGFLFNWPHFDGAI